MKKNRLGTSDLYVSEIGFGCMSLPEDEQAAIRILHSAFDQGIQFFDTADLYQFGKNEEIVGKAFKENRSEVILATKVGNRWYPNRSGWYWDPSKAYIKQAVKQSLRRLQTDYIDLYQLHGGTIDDNIDETIEAFEELKQEGVIRWYGISSIRPNVIREYVKRSNIVSVMMQYSILDRRPEEQVLELLRDHSVSAIIRGPLAKGILSKHGMEKITDEGILGYSKSELLSLWQQISRLQDKDHSMESIALRYVLAQPAVATAIPGASKLQQLLDNVKAAKAPDLTEDEITQLKRFTKALVYEAHR